MYLFKRALMALLLYVSLSLLSAQTYQKVFGDSTLQEYAIKALSTKDNCFLMLVYENTSTTTYYGTRLVKLNRSGDTLWSRKMQLVKDQPVSAGVMIRTLDGNIAIIGRTLDELGKKQTFFLSINDHGQTLWSKFVGHGDFGSTHLIQKPDSSFVLFGNSTGDQVGLQRTTQIRFIDKKGNLLNTSGSSDVSFYDEEFGSGALIASNGKLYFMATEYFSSKSYPILFKFDEQGKYKDAWAYKPRPDAVNYKGGTIIELKDKNFLIATYDDSSSYLTKIDTAGNIIFRKYFKDLIASEIILEANNDLVVLAQGLRRLAQKDKNLVVMKLSPDLDVLWRKDYGGVMNDYGDDIIKADQGYLICGTTQSFSKTYGNHDAYILGIDHQGNSPQIYKEAVMLYTSGLFSWTACTGKPIGFFGAYTGNFDYFVLAAQGKPIAPFTQELINLDTIYKSEIDSFHVSIPGDLLTRLTSPKIVLYPLGRYDIAYGSARYSIYPSLNTFNELKQSAGFCAGQPFSFELFANSSGKHTYYINGDSITATTLKTFSEPKYQINVGDTIKAITMFSGTCSFPKYDTATVIAFNEPLKMFRGVSLEVLNPKDYYCDVDTLKILTKVQTIAPNTRYTMLHNAAAWDSESYTDGLGRLFVANFKDQDQFRVGITSDGCFLNQMDTSNVFVLNKKAIDLTYFSTNFEEKVCATTLKIYAYTDETKYRFQWYKDRAPIPNATTMEVEATTTGIYHLVVSNEFCQRPSRTTSVFIDSKPSLQLPNDYELCDTVKKIVLTPTKLVGKVIWTLANEIKGTFDDHTLPTTTYNVDSRDISKGVLSFKATASGPYGKCPQVTDVLNIKLNRCVVTEVADDQDLSSSWQCYPNPATESLIIESKEVPTSVVLKDLNGGIILRTKVNEGQTTFNLSLAAINEGLYILEVAIGDQRINKKVVIAK